MADQTVKRTFPRLAASRTVPDEVKAVVGKLQRDPHSAAAGSRNVKVPDSRVLGHIANRTISNINDARNLFQVLPDMDYARQILISATLSPGDLTDTKVIYSVMNDELDTGLTGPMLRDVQEFFDDTYRIRKLLPNILNDVLFEKGSYPILIMPESSIDQIINADQYKGASLESALNSLNAHLTDEATSDGVYKPWGMLGFKGHNAGTASFESMCGTNDFVSHSYVDFPSFESRDDKNAGRKIACEALNLVAKEHKQNFMVTDNPHVLKRPMVLETKRKLAVKRIYGGRMFKGKGRDTGGTPDASKRAGVRYDGNIVHITQEAGQHSAAGSVSMEETVIEQRGEKASRRTTLNQVESAFYTNKRYKHIPVQPVLTKSQIGAETYGHPLVMHLPAESVIPITVPGNPSEHVAYFVLLDINGNPLNVTAHDNYYDDIRNQINSNDQFSTQVLQTVRRGTEGLRDFNNELIDEMTRIHADTIESDLLARLRSGMVDGEYKISRTDYINQVMFSRHLKGQKTIMLYVPAEMLTYIAFDYNEFGVGKSLLEDAKILGSIRAALMLSNTLATINNATGGKTIQITLDPKDENPTETVEFLLSEYAKVNSEGYSRIIGQTHPLGLADSIQNHGVNVMVEGNSRYPETKFDVQRRDGVNTPIDADLEKTMRDRHFQVFGLSPEVADGINQTDFATTVVQNNLMLLKRVIMNQDKFEPFLCDFVRQYILNSGVLLATLRETVEANKSKLPKEYKKDKSEGVDNFIYDFVMALKTELPAPEINDVQKQVEAYNQYTEGLEKIIDAYFSADMFITDTTQGLDTIIEPVKKNIIAEFQRRWLRKRGVLPELDIFNTLEEDESPAFKFMDIANEHMDGLVKSLMKYMKKALKATLTRKGDKETLDKLKADVDAMAQAGLDGTMSGDDNGMGGGMDGDLENTGSDGLDVDGQFDDGTGGGDDGLGGGDDGLGGLDDGAGGGDDGFGGGEDAGGTDGDASADAGGGADAAGDGGGDGVDAFSADADAGGADVQDGTADGWNQDVIDPDDAGGGDGSETEGGEDAGDGGENEPPADGEEESEQSEEEPPEEEEVKPESEEEEEEPEEEEEEDDDKKKGKDKDDGSDIDIPT